MKGGRASPSPSVSTSPPSWRTDAPSKRRHKRVRIATGVYKDRGALAACVSVGSGQNRRQSEHRFPLGTDLGKIRDWQEDEADRLRKDLPPKIARGTFDADIVAYLLTLADRPGLQAERAFQLAWWADRRGADGRRFGDRRRDSFTRAELKAALADLRRTKSAQTVKHYRTALFHLHTTLDGKDGKNPLRDVSPPSGEDPEPRHIPYEIIDAIFDAMPDRRAAVTTAMAAEIRRRAAARAANHSVIAREFGISEAMVRKVVQGVARGSDAMVQNKARLMVMAYVGLPHAQIRALNRRDVDLDRASVMVKGRKKGKGTRAQRLPLTTRGVLAFRHFIEADAFERERSNGRRTAFSASSARQLWWRAIRRMVDRVAANDWRAAKQLLQDLRAFRARPYDLRHSYLTESWLAGKDLSATQLLAMHSDARMTRRYTLAAVDERLVDVAAALSLRFTAEAPVATR